MGSHIAAGKAGQQVDGQHGLSGARAALNDQHLPLALLRSVGQLQGGLERHLLIIDHDEGVVALKHGQHRIRKAARRANATILYAVKQVPVIAIAHMLLQKIGQPLHIPGNKHRRLAGVRRVHRIVHRTAVVHIVQVGARHQANRLGANGFVVVSDQARVGPRLIRRVAGLAPAAAQRRANNTVFLQRLGLLPLLELDDDSGLLPLFVGATENEVDTLTGERDVILQGNAGVIRNPLIQHQVGHELQRVAPGIHLLGRHRA